MSLSNLRLRCLSALLVALPLLAITACKHPVGSCPGAEICVNEGLGPDGVAAAPPYDRCPALPLTVDATQAAKPAGKTVVFSVASTATERAKPGKTKACCYACAP